MNTADTPLISVIMPVYNAEKYLAEAIQSALAQTYGNIEIIYVDDCSTDGSATILKGWAQKNDNLKVYLLEKNQGVSHARNLAITHAKGEFILPLDADDLIAPEYCRLAMDVFKKTPSVAVVYSRTKLFKDEEFWEWELPEYSKERMQAGNCVHVSAFYRKADWVRFGGYDERLNALVDYDFWLHFTENDLHFFRINQFLFFYRQHATHLNISALYKVDSFKENTTKLQVWLNHKFFFKDFFSEMKLESPDKTITRIKMNILGLIKIVEKRKKYTASYRKTCLTVFGIPIAGVARSESKKKILLFGLNAHTTRL